MYVCSFLFDYLSIHILSHTQSTLHVRNEHIREQPVRNQRLRKQVPCASTCSQSVCRGRATLGAWPLGRNVKQTLTL